MPAAVTYAIKSSGDRQISHNGKTLHAGRLIQMDPTAPATIALLARGAIGTPSAETVVEGSGAELQTYTVQASGSGKISHNGVLKTTGQTIQLDPLDDTAKSLVARGVIV